MNKKPYPFDQIYQARADFISNFSSNSNKALGKLKSKCDFDVHDDSDQQFRPFIVDFNQHLSSSNELYLNRAQEKEEKRLNNDQSLPISDSEDAVSGKSNSGNIYVQKKKCSEQSQSKTLDNFQNQSTSDNTLNYRPESRYSATDKQLEHVIKKHLIQNSVEELSGNNNIYQEPAVERSSTIGNEQSVDSASSPYLIHGNHLGGTQDQIHDSNSNAKSFRSGIQKIKYDDLYHKDNRNGLSNLYSVDKRTENTGLIRLCQGDDCQTAGSIASHEPVLKDNCTNSSEGIGPTSPKVPKVIMTNGLSCDQCEFTDLECEKIKVHLKMKQHHSSSLAEGEYTNGIFKPLYVVKESYILNVSDRYKDPVPICPQCDNIFPSIYMCALHYLIHHDKHMKNKYSLAKVVKESTVVIPVRNFTCKTCNVFCNSANGLSSHWLSSRHYPYQSPESDTILYFMCNYCDQARPFYKFPDAFKHVTKTHYRQQLGGEVYLIARYMERSAGSEQSLLPRAQMSVKQQIEYDIRTLNLMIKPCNRCDTEKQNKVTKQHLQELKNKLDSIP